MRLDILKMALAAKMQGAHMGGSLSMVEIMAALYGGVINMNALVAGKEERDRLILSKGHGVMAQYAALLQAGLLQDEDLLTYKANHGRLSAHPAVNPALGIEYASGSLGIGLSLGVGAALALRRKNNSQSRVFVILGDGECNEGAVWEAAASAAHYALKNLVAIVDRNGLQYDGNTESIMQLEDFKARAGRLSAGKQSPQTDTTWPPLRKLCCCARRDHSSSLLLPSRGKASLLWKIAPNGIMVS